MDVNRKKSKPPSGLDLPDLYKQVMFSDIVKSSKELYAKGSLIEPFIMLHGLSSVELLGKIGLKISELSKKERVIFDS